MHRPGDEREPARHLAVDDVLGGAALRGLALALEDAEVVAVERGRPFALAPVALLRSLGDEDAERAARLAARAGQ